MEDKIKIVIETFKDGIRLYEINITEKEEGVIFYNNPKEAFAPEDIDWTPQSVYLERRKQFLEKCNQILKKFYDKPE